MTRCRTVIVALTAFVISLVVTVATGHGCAEKFCDPAVVEVTR